MQPDDAHFPAVGADAGHYESFYLKCGDAASRRGLWLRYTVHKRAGRGAGRVAVGDAVRRPGPARGEGLPGPDRLATGGGADWVRIGDGRIGADGCSGAIPGLAAWELRFEGGEPPFPYLPKDWMYRGKLPRTKALSLRPAVRVSGTATVRGRTVELDGWPGMIGHNWGAEHAERWIWLHGTAFAGSRRRGSTRRSAGSGSGRGRRRGSPTAACRSTACATASAGSARRAR